MTQQPEKQSAVVALLMIVLHDRALQTQRKQSLIMMGLQQ